MDHQKWLCEWSYNIFQMLPPDTSVGDYNHYYYQEYKKLYMASFVLSAQMKELLKTKDQLVTKLNKLQKKTEDFNEDLRSSNDDRKKRFRRTANEIQRNFKCTVQKCQKLYGSEGSLHQHIKLKHPQLWVQPSQGQAQGSDENQQVSDGIEE